MRFLFVIVTLTFGFHPFISAQEITRQTYNYYQDLDLDLYHVDSPEPTPVVLFVHGGGFAGGSRDNERIRYFAEAAGVQGITFVSITYRLMMKDRGFGCDVPSSEKLKTFANAALDAARATRYLLDNAVRFNIDPENIILAGSSAGAETVIHLAYWDEASTFDGKAVLPEGFQYAGVISFAGALIDDQLINQKNAIPTMLIHGTCDNLVPYGYAPHHYCSKGDAGYLMLHGAQSLADRLDYLRKPYYLITICGGNHSWAGRPILEMTDEIFDFIRIDVLSGGNRQLHSWISESGECSYEQPGECR
jgi:predicted esterase